MAEAMEEVPVDPFEEVMNRSPKEGDEEYDEAWDEEWEIYYDMDETVEETPGETFGSPIRRQDTILRTRDKKRVKRYEFTL